MTSTKARTSNFKTHVFFLILNISYISQRKPIYTKEAFLKAVLIQGKVKAEDPKKKKNLSIVLLAVTWPSKNLSLVKTTQMKNSNRDSSIFKRVIMGTTEKTSIINLNS